MDKVREFFAECVLTAGAIGSDLRSIWKIESLHIGYGARR
jgi:hypothetical protein